MEVQINGASFQCEVRPLRTGDVLSFFRLLATVGGSVDEVSELFSAFEKEARELKKDSLEKKKSEKEAARRGIRVAWTLFNNLMTRGFDDFVSWIAALIEVQEPSGITRRMAAKELQETPPDTLLYVLKCVSEGGDLARFFSGLLALYSSEQEKKEQVSSKLQ